MTGNYVCLQLNYRENNSVRKKWSELLHEDELRSLEKRQYKFYTQLKDIKKLRKIITIAKVNIHNAIIPSDIVEHNIFIAKINQKYTMNIEYINNKWTFK